MSDTLKFTTVVTPYEGGGFAAEIIGSEGQCITAGIYGDTEAEAAMTAVYGAFATDDEEEHSGWRHTQMIPDNNDHDKE